MRKKGEKEKGDAEREMVYGRRREGREGKEEGGGKEIARRREKRRGVGGGRLKEVGGRERMKREEGMY